MCCALLAMCTAAAGERPAEILWRAPRMLTGRDWVCGPGGCGNAPAAPFRFLKEDLSGTTPKVTVRDARGREWSVKFGGEVIAECFAPRFLSALGYFAEHTYFVASGKLEGAGKLHRARRVITPDGRFERGRFEPRDDPEMKFLPNSGWSWVDTAFRGTHEMAGLKIAMMLLSNWDAKDARDGTQSNNAMFRIQVDGRSTDVLAVYDWGAALGRWGGPLRRDESDCAGFWRDSSHFVRGVHGNEVEFGFEGKHGEDLKSGITRLDVAWLLPYLERIPPRDLRAGLQASGATPRQAGCWAAGIEERIGELRRVR